MVQLYISFLYYELICLEREAIDVNLFSAYKFAN